LGFYELWDSGDYNSAKDKAQELMDIHHISLNPPDAVTVLGGKWPQLSGHTFTGFPPELYDPDGDLFKVYVYDELKRIKRLYEHEDYRSTFLRAGGLNEIIMVARLVNLVRVTNDKENLLRALAHNRTPDIGRLFEALLQLRSRWVNNEKKFTSIRTREITVGENRGNKPNIRIPNTPFITIPVTQPMNRWWQNNSQIAIFDQEHSWHHFLQMRNKLIHTYVSVPDKYAREAINFVEANLEDFIGIPESYADKVNWPDLCGMCGLTPYLPPNLVKGEDTNA
jgi:hypothetical protein